MQLAATASGSERLTEYRRQHATDDTGMSKHRLSPYYAYYQRTHFKFYSFRFQSDETRRRVSWKG